MTLKLDMQHLVNKYCQICPNDNPGLTLTYFIACNVGSENLFICSRSLDHTHICQVKNLKHFFLVTKRQMTLKLEYYQFLQMMTMG